MKLNTWLRLQVILSQLKRGNILVLFYGEVNGSAWYENHVEVTMGRKDRKFEINYDDTPYSKEELSESFSEDYIIGHPLTERSVNKYIYTTKIYTNSEQLIVKSSNSLIGESLQRQYDAISYMDIKVLKYAGHTIDFSKSSFRGISHGGKKRRFDNIIEYNNYEKVKQLKRNSNSVEIV